MWKIAAAGIAFTLLAACLKQIKEEYRTYLMLAAGDSGIDCTACL